MSKTWFRPISSSGDYILEDSKCVKNEREKSTKEEMEKRMYRAHKIILKTHLPSKYAFAG